MSNALHGLLSDDDLMRYIERAIVHAYRFVDEACTDQAVVMGILSAYSGYSPDVQNLIRHCVRGLIGDPVYDTVAGEAAERQMNDVVAGRGLEAYYGVLNAGLAAWLDGHASMIDALCDKHAGLLLAAQSSQEMSDDERGGADVSLPRRATIFDLVMTSPTEGWLVGAIYTTDTASRHAVVERRYATTHPPRTPSDRRRTP